MELSSSVFEMVQLDGVEYFIRLCCGVSGFIGTILGSFMITKAFYLVIKKYFDFSVGEDRWFEEGELMSECNKEIELIYNNWISGRTTLPSPEEMDQEHKVSPLELLSSKKEKKMRRLKIDKFRRSHFNSNFKFQMEVVNIDTIINEKTVLTFLKKKAEKNGVHDGKPIYETPITTIGAGIKTLNAVYSCV